MEIHAPLGPIAPKVLEIRELYTEIGSPRLGFVADFSATMRRMSPTLLRKLARLGLASRDLERLQGIWATDADINNRHSEFVGYLGSHPRDGGVAGAHPESGPVVHRHVTGRRQLQPSP